MPYSPEPTVTHRPVGEPGDAETQPSGTLDENRLPPGGRLGRFALLELLGRGGFGVVYRAHDEVLDREVALKLPLLRSNDPDQTERFAREARAAGQLRHPNIVVVFDSGRIDGQYFIASEFVHGETLQQRIHQQPVELDEACRWIADLARALDYAHREGVVHRDIKPENIMLGPRDRPQLMDFGLAKRRADGDDGMTLDGTVFGTPAYMSPEQARGETRDVGPSSDQYSLGVVLYLLLCGRKPFEGQPLTLLDQIKNTAPPPLRAERPEIPRDLEAICLKALEKQPRHRYPDAGGLADDLQRWREGQTVRARPVSSAERFGRWCRRNPLVAGLASAVAFALLAGLVGVSLALGVARTNLNLANAKTKEAKSAEQRAVAARHQAEQDAARTRILFAQRQWERKNLAWANRLLDQVPNDLRSWEWRYCRRLCRLDLRRVARHASRIHALATSSSGRFATSSDRSVKIWSRNGAPVATFHNLASSRIALSPDGRYLAVAPDVVRSTEQQQLVGSAEVELWDIEQGERWKTLVGCPGVVAQIQFSPDGSRLAAACGDRRLALWRTDGEPEAELLGPHPAEVQGVAFSPDGRSLVAAASHSLTVWDVAQRERRFVLTDTDLTPRRPKYRHVAFHPDGRRLASAGTSLATWDLSQRRKTKFRALPLARPVFALNYSPDGNRLSLLQAGNKLHVLDARTLTEVYGSSPDEGEFVSAADWQADGRLILADALPDGAIRFWSESPAATRLEVNSAGVSRAAFGPRGRLLGTASFPMMIKAAHPNADSAPLMTSFPGNLQFQLWRTASGMRGDEEAAHKNPREGNAREPPWKAAGTPAFGSDFVFLANPPRVARCGPTALKITALPPTAADLEERNAPEVEIPVAARQFVSGSLAASPDGRRLAAAFLESGTATRKNTEPEHIVKLWDAGTGERVRTLEGAASRVMSLAFSADGSRLAGGSFDGMLHLWNITTGEHRAWKAHDTLITDVAFAPGGMRLATASHDNSAKLWDAASGKLLQTLTGHGRSGVYAVAFHPREPRLASAGGDGAVRLWDLQSGEVVLELLEHAAAVLSVAFDPSGRWLASADRDGLVCLWEAPPPDHAEARKIDHAAEIPEATPREVIVQRPVLTERLTAGPAHVEEFENERTSVDGPKWLRQTKQGRFVIERRRPGGGHWFWTQAPFPGGVAEVKFRIVRGGGGLVCLRNKRQKVGVRVDLREDRIRIRPMQFAGQPGPPPMPQIVPLGPARWKPGRWHTLRVLIDGRRAEVFLDGLRLTWPVYLKSDLTDAVVCLGILGIADGPSRVEYESIRVYAGPQVQTE